MNIMSGRTNGKSILIEILKDRYSDCRDATERLFIEEELYEAREECRRLAFEEFIKECEAE